jgi:hypothetical protein
VLWKAIDWQFLASSSILRWALMITGPPHHVEVTALRENKIDYKGIVSLPLSIIEPKIFLKIKFNILLAR